MNVLARIGMSLFALSACAVAMRYTMIEVSVPESELQDLEWRYKIPPRVKEVQVRLDAWERDRNIFISHAEQARHVTARFLGTKSHKLIGEELKRDPKTAQTMQALRIVASKMTERNFFLNKDFALGGQIFLGLPKSTLTDLKIRGSDIDIIYANLEYVLISNFIFNSYSSKIKIFTSKKDYRSYYFIGNIEGETEFQVHDTSRGFSHLVSERGIIDLSLHKNLLFKINICEKLKDKSSKYKYDGLKFIFTGLKIDLNRPGQAKDCIYDHFSLYNFDLNQQKPQFEVYVEIDEKGTLNVSSWRPG